MVEEHGQSGVIACPVHPDNPRIQQVSVLYAARGPRLLRPVPVLTAATRLAWTGTACGALGAAAILTGAAIGGGAVGPSLIAGAICLAYALAFYGWAAARRARLRLIERGRPGAMAVWQAAWYCDMCDGVFFRPGTFGHGAMAEGVGGMMIGDDVVLTLAAFHRLVWQAAGYGRPLKRLVG
jgi:hypothetical protein